MLIVAVCQAADECNYSAIAYEFVKEGLLIYESEVSDSKAQVRSIEVLLLVCGDM